MADEPVVTPPEDEEEGGGPVKSFLDHLEDLRWMLIKSVAAIGVGFVVCLIGGNTLMTVLKWPLERSLLGRSGTNQVVSLYVGTNLLGKFSLGQGQLGSIEFGYAPRLALQIATIRLGSNEVMTLMPSTNAPPPETREAPVKLMNLGPAGGFLVAFQLAVYGGIVLASPFVIYYVAQFVVPALKRKEKKYVLRGFGIGTILFLLGVSFCYFILMPLALNASAKYSQWLGIAADQWTAEQYISFVCKFMLGMGLGFEMPVVILILVKIGIVTYSQLAAFRRYMLVINLVLGAVLTTPEVLTQIMMAIPLQLLYEISVWIAWYWERQEKKREAAAAGAEVQA